MRNAIIPEHLSFVRLKSNPTPDIEQREREREREKKSHNLEKASRKQNLKIKLFVST